MNFEFSAEQQALRDTLRKMLSSHASMAHLRRLWRTETGRDTDLWKLLSEVGIPGFMIPIEFGGLAADELDMYVVLEEAGRAAIPDAVLESCLLAPVMIGGSDVPAIKERWLPDLAAGTIRATVARGGTLIAPDAHVSDLVIIEVDGVATVLEKGEFSMTPLLSMNPSDRLYEIHPMPDAGTSLGSGAVQIEETYRLAGASAMLSGLADELLARAVEYSKVREQFGRTIGSFQAIKHQLAHAHSQNTLARIAAVAANAKLASKSVDAPDAAALAFLCALEAEKESNRASLQVHGGIGFSWEHDLHILLKFGKSLELVHRSHREAAELAGRVSTHARGLAV